MKEYSNEDVEQLKKLFCQDDDDALWKLLEISFPDIWVNIIEHKFNDQIDVLLNLKTDIKNNKDEFCASQEPVLDYLRKIFRRKLSDARKRSAEFNEAHMNTQQEEFSQPFNIDSANEENKKEPSDLFYFLHNHFFFSLSPVQRIIYDVKKRQDLNRKNGLFQIVHFWVNTCTTGYPELLMELKSDQQIYEPLIPEYLVRHSKMAFTNYSKPSSESLLSLLHNLPSKRHQLSKAFHSRDVGLFRKHNKFECFLKEIDELSILEKASILINNYLEIRDGKEFWIQLNIDGLTYLPLQEQLIDHQLWIDEIQIKHAKTRGPSLYKLLNSRWKTVKNSITEIQDIINTKIEKPIQWKIR